MSGVYVLLRAQTKSCRRMSCSCSEGQGCMEQPWIVFAGVGELAAALQAVSASPILYKDGHVCAGLAIRSPHCKLGIGGGWQHDHRQENWGPQHMPSEHGERQREKRSSICRPLWSRSLDLLLKGKVSAQSSSLRNS